jgi:hypothetical protein
MIDIIILFLITVPLCYVLNTVIRIVRILKEVNKDDY